ncbi:aldehyde dehydrogenase family protein, partial [Halomonas sp. MG34]|nr:aldehyde dehydrogenase family protein [Halomonas sp. MG34]
MNTLDLLIGGHSRSAHESATFEHTNPLSGETVTCIAAASVSDAQAAAEAAARAFPAWSATGPGEKRAKLLKAAEVMETRQAEFIERMVDETGATPGWAGFNVMVAASILRE